MSPTDTPRRHVEGRPIVRRFVVKRLPLAILSDRPWKVRDRERPAYLGSAKTHAEALAIVAHRLEFEAQATRDLATARNAWMREINA